jgi:hypothetical protein
MIQFFHWYSPGNGILWKDFARQVSYLAGLGFTDAWLPPPYKGGSGGASVGYDVYDLFDIGEFKQQGTIVNKIWNKTRIHQCHSKSAQKKLLMLSPIPFLIIRPMGTNWKRFRCEK